MAESSARKSSCIVASVSSPYWKFETLFLDFSIAAIDQETLLFNELLQFCNVSDPSSRLCAIIDAS